MTSTRLMIGPQSLSIEEDVQFLRLPHPRHRQPTLFLPHADSLLEVQAVAPEDSAKRSWFCGESVISDGKLYMLTAFDPVFMVAALILLASRTTDISKGRALPYPDIFDEAVSMLYGSPQYQFTDVVTFGELPCARRAAESICTVDIVSSETSVYRLSKDKLIASLHLKMNRLTVNEVFANASFPTIAALLAKQGVEDSNAVTAEVLVEARQKIALDILCNYLPDSIETVLRGGYSSTNLDLHVASQNVARDLAGHMPGFKPAAPGTKNRWQKKADEKKAKDSKGKGKDFEGNGKPKPDKKKGPAISTGVRQLEKVYTGNNSKLSSFFTKVEVKAEEANGFN